MISIHRYCGTNNYRGEGQHSREPVLFECNPSLIKDPPRIHLGLPHPRMIFKDTCAILVEIISQFNTSFYPMTKDVSQIILSRHGDIFFWGGGERFEWTVLFFFYFLFHFNKPKPSGIYKIETSRQTCWRRQEPSCDSQRFAGRFINFNAMILADSTTPSSFSRISSSFKARLKRITMPAA